MFDTLHHLLDRLEQAHKELGVAERSLRELNAPKPPAAPVPSPYDVVLLLEHMAAGRKIEAIKLYRQLTEHGLKEAKDAVENITSRFVTPHV